MTTKIQSIATLLLLMAGFAAPLVAEETAEDKTITAGEFTFRYDAPWVRQEVTSPMRKGQLTYDHENEALEDVDVVVYYFGQGQGGGIQANINRWIGQFEGTPESNTEEITVGDRTLTLLTASGTFNQPVGGPFSGKSTPKENQTMLAAILPSDQGAVFLKLTGPSDSVAAMKDAFVEFAKSPFPAEEAP